MRRTPFETAVLLALMLNRSNKTRGRVSEQTFRKVARREQLRTAFKEQVRYELEDLNVFLFELGRYGFALVAASALNGAPSLTANKLISEDLNHLGNGKKTIKDLINELGLDDDDEDSEE